MTEVAPSAPVIAGIGATRLAARGTASEQALGMRAILAALADAGVEPADVDGVVRFDRGPIWEFDLTGGLAMRDLAFYAAAPLGGGAAPALVRLAAMAVAQERARVVVGFHARGTLPSPLPPAGLAGPEQFQVPFGVVSPEQRAAILVRRHMERFGTTARALAQVTVTIRRHATRNPGALARTPLGLVEHRRSPLVAEPLRRVDCAVPALGAAAFVVTTHDRARDLDRPPVRVLGSMQAVVPSAARHLVAWPRATRVRAVAREARAMFRAARLRPADVDVACLWDAPSPLVLFALEDFGFCRRGASGAFVEGGGLARPRLNPHGGQLAEGELDGINDVIEAVRQLRGDARLQVPGARVALVAGSPLEPTSAVLLGV